MSVCVQVFLSAPILITGVSSLTCCKCSRESWSKTSLLILRDRELETVLLHSLLERDASYSWLTCCRNLEREGERREGEGGREGERREGGRERERGREREGEREGERREGGKERRREVGREE